MRWLMVSFGVAAIALAVLAVVWPRIAPTTNVDLLPLLGDRAVLLRVDRDSHEPQWLQTIGKNESVVRMPFYAHDIGNVLDATSLVSAGPSIVVRDRLGGISGFDDLTLKQRWHATRFPAQADQQGSGFSLAFLSQGTSEGLVEVWGAANSTATIIASDPATGKERWRHEVKVGFPGPLVIEAGAVFVDEEPGLEVFDLRTGATRRTISGARDACFAGEHALYQLPGPAGAELHVLSLATLADVAVSPPLSPEPAPTGACFWHGGTVAAIVHEQADARSPADLVVYDASSGAERHRTPLPGIESLDPWYSGGYAANDDDVRFAPVLVPAAGNKRRVLFFDLEQGTAATAGEPFADTTARVAVDHGRYYLHARQPAAIAAVDGATGKVVARACLPDGSKARFGGTRAWVFDDKRWALLDGGKLAPIAGELAPHACTGHPFGLP